MGLVPAEVGVAAGVAAEVAGGVAVEPVAERAAPWSSIRRSWREPG
jgi:hypothetical protein